MALQEMSLLWPVDGSTRKDFKQARPTYACSRVVARSWHADAHASAGSAGVHRRAGERAGRAESRGAQAAGARSRSQVAWLELCPHSREAALVTQLLLSCAG